MTSHVLLRYRQGKHCGIAVMSRVEYEAWSRSQEAHAWIYPTVHTESGIIYGDLREYLGDLEVVSIGATDAAALYCLLVGRTYDGCGFTYGEFIDPLND